MTNYILPHFLINIHFGVTVAVFLVVLVGLHIAIWQKDVSDEFWYWMDYICYGSAAFAVLAATAQFSVLVLDDEIKRISHDIEIRYEHARQTAHYSADFLLKMKDDKLNTMLVYDKKSCEEDAVWFREVAVILDKGYKSKAWKVLKDKITATPTKEGWNRIGDENDLPFTSGQKVMLHGDLEALRNYEDMLATYNHELEGASQGSSRVVYIAITAWLLAISMAIRISKVTAEFCKHKPGRLE